MVGLALFELEGLGEINDRAGLDGGDETLRVIANRLRRAKLPGETAARLDGCEFALLMTDFLLAPHALARGREVAAALHAPVVLGSAQPPWDSQPASPPRRSPPPTRPRKWRSACCAACSCPA